MPLTLKEDDGYFRLTVETAAGDVGVDLDLFEALNVYATLCDQFDPAEKTVELAAAWVEWLTTKGCPALSHGSAMLLAAHVRDAVAEFKKKHAVAWGNTDSPSSSEPPSTTAPSPG